MTAPEEVSFKRDISPLFRDIDIAEMRFAFDLLDYDEVREYAEAIYERVAEGSMPCDGSWPAEQVRLFRRWIDGGSRP